MILVVEEEGSEQQRRCDVLMMFDANGIDMSMGNKVVWQISVDGSKAMVSKEHGFDGKEVPDDQRYHDISKCSGYNADGQNAIPPAVSKLRTNSSPSPCSNR